ncbi:MAG: flavodoxin domain-containing protein [Brevefilum sp.]|nr:flavodoxin domain-containing protein [Brevefilum sp.]MDW7753686.1 flavodoxin domain-containing protein [Brevefilum sp.]
MDKRILITYGTVAGSTEEVARTIGEEMQNAGALVEIKPVEDVKSVEGYDGLVVGSAVRMFHLLGKTRRFLRKHKKALENLPLAFFVVCLTMGEETPENIERAKGYAKPMLGVKDPVSLGLFGGCIDHEKLTDFFGKSMKSVPEQDHRDWDKIRAWGRDTHAQMFD